MLELTVLSLLFCVLFYVDARRMVRYETQYRDDERSALKMLFGIPQYHKGRKRDWTVGYRNGRSSRYDWISGGTYTIGAGGGGAGGCGTIVIRGEGGGGGTCR